MAFLIGVFSSCGLVILLFGLQAILFFPLTLLYEVWKRRFLERWGEDWMPSISVIVPAYNEENTIASSVASILSSDYPDFEVIVVNDGSTDQTENKLHSLIASHRIVYVAKNNGGKASALNAGIALARGDIILYTDADSFFGPDTLRKAGRWFVDPGIHAVCGNDTPLAPETALQKLLTLTTHIGTGFVRRAFSVLNVMPIISGNTGAVRREWLDTVGGFSDVWGEDLDLTFKLQRAGARIVYDSEVLVTCEVPRDVISLWKQRIRWTRSYLKIVAHHKDMFFRPAYYPFSLYLPINWISLVCIPLLQVLLLIGLPFALNAGAYTVGGPIDVASSLGYGLFLVIVVYSALLDRTPGHLKYLPLYGWLIIPISLFYNGVVIYSLYAEASNVAERWEKIERRNFSSLPLQRRRMLKVVCAGIAPVLAVPAIAWMLVRTSDTHAHRMLPPVAAHQPQVTMATHFDAWTNPSDAITSVLQRDHSSIVTSIGLGAGRYEWNFFRWQGHERSWSNDQRMTGSDLLENAIAVMRQNNRRVISIVDMYAPTFLREHPDLAARGADGAVSTEQVCFTDLVSGHYGSAIKEMVNYLARSYDIEGISLTELEYNRFCYDERCLASFKAFSGLRDWPRRFFTREINRNASIIGKWRSALLARYLNEVADSVHAYSKRFYIDVPIHYHRLKEEGLSSGLSYPGLLRFVDALVVWDYFYLEGRSPATSEDVARFFVEKYGTDRIIMSVGLWGNDVPVSPDDLSNAVYYAQVGGATRIWVTPNHLVTEAHWKKLVQLYRGTDGAGMQ